PPKYKNVAVRYNNVNVSLNQKFTDYREDNLTFADSTNLDSSASEIYFQNFVNYLKNQKYFDSVFELEPMNFSGIKLSDSLIYLQIKSSELADSVKHAEINTEVFNFVKLVKSFANPDSSISKTKFIDPENGLY